MTLQTNQQMPELNEEAQAHSHALLLHMREAIQQSDGNWLDFANFMDLALYTPHLGYYSGGAKKFGQGGDFVTAPEISALFSQALANQLSQVIDETNGDILELGAGTGQLALDVLLTLHQTSQLPQHYYIIEVSDYLRQIQLEKLQQHLPVDVFERVHWLNTLPDHFAGVVVGNEVLDAIPVHLIYKNNGQLFERGVAWQNGLAWQDKPLQDGDVLQLVNQLHLDDDYLTEVCPAATGLIHSLATMLEKGAIIMLDYGFGESEYYHPQRRQGTLMCHYQHHAHDDPLLHVGLQDITAHVNFTAIAEAGFAHGCNVHYVNQASFLMNCGLLQLLEQKDAADMATYAPYVAAVQKLMSPAEMGELFKVIGFSKGLSQPLMGFVSGDKRHSL